jgi:membrane fusion protein, multidrug efflux system
MKRSSDNVAHASACRVGAPADACAVSTFPRDRDKRRDESRRGRQERLRHLGLLLLSAWGALAQTGALAPVVSRNVSRTVELPGEISPYLSVSLHARVPGYVERVLVDRGAAVKKGELLAELSAPEMTSRIAEAESKAQAAQSDRAQAEAQVAAAQSTYERLNKAAETPGAIAGNELVQAEKHVQAGQALVQAREQAVRAAQAAAAAQREMEAYLKIAAPFDGVVTERLVHPGALVGPEGGALLAVQQVSRLRLVVAVPEEDVGGIVTGAAVPFRVPAYPERAYSGTVARAAHALDPKTRSMAVELDVSNRDGSLAPGMYATVKWPVRRARPALLVPKTSVVATSERTFVIRDRGGRAEWVDVAKGAPDGDLVEVMGNLRPGDMVVRRGTDELREGMPVARK